MSRSAALELLDYHPHEDDVTEEILLGLRREQKTLPSKYFYDERGSKLFDEITELPEYYPTRTELGIMRDNLAEIAELVGPQASVIEFGSGSSMKTGMLLEDLPELAAYVPVEISCAHLMDAARRLAERYPEIEILPVCADFTQPFELPNPKLMPVRNLVYFPGSTIGNFDPPEARHLLEVMAGIAKAGGVLLIGVDLKKDVAVLERAYNDSAGVTAEFNLNLLRRINRELDADFELDAFSHRAIYNAGAGRIEMHLVSQRDQTVTVAGVIIGFRAGEHIVTEHSHKYTLEEFAALAAPAGFAVRHVWTDLEDLFSVQCLEVAD